MYIALPSSSIIAIHTSPIVHAELSRDIQAREASSTFIKAWGTEQQHETPRGGRFI
jgi:hypothetical protein